MVDYLVSLLLVQPSKPCLTQRSFYRLRKAAREVPGIVATDITPSTRLMDLVPVPGRQQVWRDIEHVVSMALPRLRRSDSVVLAGGLLALTGMIAAGLASLAWLGVVVFGLLVAGFWAATRRFRIHFEVDTVGGLARLLAAQNVRQLVSTEERWSRRQIEEVVVGLVRGVSGLDEVDFDAHFVRDLGLD